MKRSVAETVKTTLGANRRNKVPKRQVGSDLVKKGIVAVQDSSELGRKPTEPEKPCESAVPDSGRPDLSTEKHYSVGELAWLWGLSENTIRRMFENEPGVLLWRSRETRSKRAYTTLRIPESVALRIHRRLRIAG